MASPNSITSEVSSKIQLPIKHSIPTEAKASRSREWFVTDDASPSVFQKIVAELVGTYILIFVGCGVALTDEVQRLTMVGIAIAWGVVLMALIYAVGHVSGAHFNPAVSIAFAAGRKFPWKHVPMYILAQVLGSTLASLTLRVLFNDLDDIEVTVTQYKDSTSDLEAIIWEFIITFILMFNILAVATDYRASKDLSGVAIGGTLLFNALLAGPITGASMNPARSLGPAIVSGVYKNLWVFIVSPIFGALAATYVYNMLRVPEPEKSEEKTKNIFNHLYTATDP
ncbi:nodulin-26 [Ricinus communis]|uniref:nodulin-26 n=1 Tax=Ricinus communis TaxID=3988 RepID=UPI000D68E123|nr:nodulin-26 [Ricinus communis]|eukprot:XP_025012197.1 nodulin-26 [Ricinus communis]